MSLSHLGCLVLLTLVGLPACRAPMAPTSPRTAWVSQSVIVTSVSTNLCIVGQLARAQQDVNRGTAIRTPEGLILTDRCPDCRTDHTVIWQGHMDSQQMTLEAHDTDPHAAGCGVIEQVVTQRLQLTPQPGGGWIGQQINTYRLLDDQTRHVTGATVVDTLAVRLQ